MNYKDKYYKYLKSSKWRLKRQHKFNQVGRRCEECGSLRKLHVHHLTYDRLYVEKLEDLKVLCEVCHMEAHKIISKDKKKTINIKPKKQLVRINKKNRGIESAKKYKISEIAKMFSKGHIKLNEKYLKGKVVQKVNKNKTKVSKEERKIKCEEKLKKRLIEFKKISDVEKIYVKGYRFSLDKVNFKSYQVFKMLLMAENKRIK